LFDIGEMVMCRGKTARVTDLDIDRVDCIHVDRNGDVTRLTAHPDDVEPLWLAYSPKSSWPDIRSMDDSLLENSARALD
jgi:hypothetical protein